MKLITIGILLLFFAVQTNAQIDWRKSGYTTIDGEIENFEEYYNEQNSIEIQVDDWTNAYRRTIFTEIDSFGRFSISFFIFQTQEVLLYYNNQWRYVFVTPDDTLNVVIDANKFRKTCGSTIPDSTQQLKDPEIAFYGLKYEGSTAKICQDYDNFTVASRKSTLSGYSSENNNKIKELSFYQYNAWRDSIYKTQEIELNRLIEENQYDDFFHQFIKSKYYLSYIYDLLSYYSWWNGHDQEPDSIRITQSLNLANSTLSVDYQLLHANPESYFTIINNHINGLIREIGNQNFHESYSDAVFNAEKSEQREKITTINELSTQERLTAQFPFIIKAAGAIKDDLIRQSLIAHHYTMTLEYNNADPGLDLALASITNEDIKASIINARNHFLWRTSNLNASNLNPDGDTILNYLHKKYQDHVLYINFWGTWCGVCYGNFEALPVLKERLKGKKVAFIYLCCNCDMEKWSGTIDEYGLGVENIFLSSEQYAHLATRFNIIGVPKYVIIDPDGKVVNDRAPQPGNHPKMIEMVANEIIKYLN